MNNQVTSEDRSAFYTKLLTVQQELGAVKKSAKNPFFKSNYADLNAHLELVKPIANKHGLYIQQGITVVNSQQGAKDAVYSKVIDAISGLAEESVMLLEDCKGNMQTKGGAATYARRYTLSALFSMQAEDDDGNLASGKTSKKTKTIATKDTF